MPDRLWNCVILITVVVTSSGSLMAAFAQAKDQMPSLDRVDPAGHPCSLWQNR
jgi:hypothetical protein